MSEIKGKVGAWEITWTSVPHGSVGSAWVKFAGENEAVEVSWRKDAHGIWVELPTGVHGFDLAGSRDDDGKIVYRLGERGTDAAWTGLAFLRSGEAQAGAAGAGKKKGVRVRAQMPGKIVRILVKAGQAIEKDQPLLVMEAMKMENEIRAAAEGEVKEIKVSEGQAVETGADLILLG